MPVYGNDFSSLQSGVAQDQALRQSAIQSAMANMLNAWRSAQNHALQLRQLQFTEDQTKIQNADRRQQLQGQAFDRITGAIDRNRKANIDSRYLDLAESEARRKAMEPDARTEKKRQLQFQQADIDAQEGAFETDKDVLKLYPNLDPEEAKVIARRSSTARPQIEQQYNVASGMAEILNRKNDATRRLQEANKGVDDEKGSGRWFNGTAIKKAQDEVTKVNSDLQDLSSKLPSDRKLVDKMVYFEPGQNKYVPAVTPPSWKKKNDEDGTSAAAPKTEAKALVRTSDGRYLEFPKAALSKVLQRDPGAKVVDE